MTTGIKAYNSTQCDLLARVDRAFKILYSNIEWQYESWTDDGINVVTEPFNKGVIKRVLFTYYLECREIGVLDEFKEAEEHYRKKYEKCSLNE